MADLIERQAAIDALIGELNERISDDDAWIYDSLGRHEIRAILAKIPSAQPENIHAVKVTLTDEQVMKGLDKMLFPQTQPQWIPCSERLPDKDGRYLTTCSNERVLRVDWNIWYNKPKPSWLWEQGVTAWMPLPEPYEEEQS